MAVIINNAHIVNLGASVLPTGTNIHANTYQRVGRLSM